MINIDIPYVNFTQLSNLLCVCVRVFLLYPETENSDCLQFYSEETTSVYLEVDMLCVGMRAYSTLKEIMCFSTS